MPFPGKSTEPLNGQILLFFLSVPRERAAVQEGPGDHRDLLSGRGRNRSKLDPFV